MASVDSLSGGRLVFCPAVDSEPNEFGPMGIPRAERGKIMTEWLQIIYRLWAEGKPPLDYAMSSAPPLKILDKGRSKDNKSAEPVEYFTGEGTPGELIREFKAFEQAGATTFVVNFWGNTAGGFLRNAEIFAREVMSAFQTDDG